MNEFSAETEGKTLAKMVAGFEYETYRNGGSAAAGGLQGAINDAWCKLTPDQKAATSDKIGSNTVLKDGFGADAAIKTSDGGVVPLNCDRSENRR